MNLNRKSRAAQAAGAGIAWLTGWRIVQQAASAVGDAIAAAGRIGMMVKPLFSRRRPGHETFSQAVGRLGLTEGDLQKQLGDIQFRASLWLAVFCISLTVLVISPLVSNPASHALNAAAITTVGLARWLSWRFRGCQCRARALYGFGGWIVKDPMVRKVWAGSLVALLALGILGSAVAHAADGMNAFTPAAGDASVTFLREVFGPVIDSIWNNSGTKGGDIDSPLGRMLGPFNSAALFLGAVFVAYTTIKGTVDSAHDGEVLGRKMSSIWVPLRTVAGSALVLPGVSGYSIIQYGVLWLAIQSAGIANAILGAGLDYVAETNMVARPHLPDTRQLAAGILKSEVCMAAMNKQYVDEGRNNRIVPEEKVSIVTNTGDSDVTTASYRVIEYHWREMIDGQPARRSPDVCGALTWDQSGQSVAEGNSSTAKQQILAAQTAAVHQMIASLRPVAQQIVGFGSPTPGAIEAAAAAYETALTQAAKTSVEQTSDSRRAEFIAAVKSGGWIYLPTYYNQLIQLNDTMQSALNALPATSPISIEDKEVSDTLQTYRDAMLVANEYLKARADAPVQERKRQFKQDGEFPTSWGDFKRLLSGFAQTGIYEFTQQLAGSNLSHVGQIKAVGDTIMGGAETIATLAFISNGTANSNAAKLTVGNVFDTGAALGSINPILMTVVISLMAFGAVAAYYIPLIPFIVGITAVIKWFVLVFESVIAAPIFAVAHMHPDGHDAVGTAGPGYMLILGLLMRPALTVLGFFGSIWLAQPVTGYINITYMTAVQGAEHNSFSFIAAFVAYIVIYVIIMTSVVHTIFTLVNWLPDNVLRWIGGGLNAHGVGDAEPKEAEHQYNAALLAMGRGGHGAGHGGQPIQPKGNAGIKSKAKDDNDGPSNSDLMGG